MTSQLQYEKNGGGPLILKNSNLEIHIAHPLEYYKGSRFDWTGKIISVKYKSIEVTGVEKMKVQDEFNYGKGFYNEFGIEAAVGFSETKMGDWFHKIGVGLLKKQAEEYSFATNYEIRPAEFTVSSLPNKIKIHCKSQSINDYAYELIKEIELLESSFVIHYFLKNTGEKAIITNEYNHNFLAVNKDLIGSNYVLTFPFEIKPKLFGETVNPEQKVTIGQNKISFSGTPQEQFFFSKLSGNEKVPASWELINTKNKPGISETGNFTTQKINLWGWKHVISPELFFEINIKPGEEIRWERRYRIFEVMH
ncbi:MAG: hypothetical protein K9H49_14665 [Bacteroidales bacterium]|nr:hypothetical protein [Bacteroidales bacterium]MCF8390543.1 hypothetical protein [Bacteroidales bacterium]